jgi:hypothetical protein
MKVRPKNIIPFEIPESPRVRSPFGPAFSRHGASHMAGYARLRPKTSRSRLHGPAPRDAT